MHVTMSTNIIRSVALPRVSMARIPIVAFASNANPYSSTATASKLADKLEQSAKNLGSSSSNLSQHASDAIRMLESQTVLKQDKARINTFSDEEMSSTELFEPTIIASGSTSSPWISPKQH